MPAVVSARLRLRYTEGGSRAEERRSRGVQSGWPATGGRWTCRGDCEFNSGTRRAVSGLKSAGAVVSNLGARREGGRRFGGFGAKPPPTPGSGKLRRLLRKLPRWTGSWAGNAHGHAGFDGLGLKTITALFGSAEARIR